MPKTRDSIDANIRRLKWLYSHDAIGKGTWLQAAIMKAKREKALLAS